MRYHTRKQQNDEYQKPQAKKRICLGANCGAEFLSTGPHHRMCTSCRHNASNPMDDFEFSVSYGNGNGRKRPFVTDVA